MNEFECDLNPDLFNKKGHVGFVAIVGRPNVGKSTLMNQVLDYHLAAVSSRPQTTRKLWRGIFSDDDSQIIFTDTPGIHAPIDKLGEAMTSSISSQLSEADLVLCIVDAYRERGAEDELVVKAIAGCTSKVILAINKVDEATPLQVEETSKYFKNALGNKILGAYRISALKNRGVEALLKGIKAPLPVMPFLYDPEVLTDAFERDIVTELIQEAVFERFTQEVPHGLTVIIDQWKETDKKIRIMATIHIDHERHKKMIIGKNGEMINKVKSEAVSKIRENIDKHIDLKLYAKVSPDWRNNRKMLDEFGYNG